MRDGRCSGWSPLFRGHERSPAPDDPGDLGDLLADLGRQPERLRQARLAGVAGSRRRHDWVHRWAEVLDVAGLPPTPAMAERLEALEGRAQLAADRLASG